ncbi:MAG: hypothetical protein NVSMB27_04790 [Ktedonobacteraceae bacterium]
MGAIESGSREVIVGMAHLDLVGYRRWGHNEGDEPAFTQPRMYEIIGCAGSYRAG